MNHRHLILPVLLAMLVVAGCSTVFKSVSTDPEVLRQGGRQALDELVAANPVARRLDEEAVAVLVFPTVLKGGLIYGAQTGNGVLFEGGEATAFYNTTAVSYGLQAGVQDYGYALFFMHRAALDVLNRAGGLELGVGPSVVMVDEGFAKQYSTTTLSKDIYAFTFNQQGFMAGLGITGSKITRIRP
jgi:lipid-binding SYLF domain-containing protein